MVVSRDLASSVLDDPRMLGMKVLDGGDCSFQRFECIGEAFQIHGEEDQERLDMILPPCPIA